MPAMEKELKVWKANLETEFANLHLEHQKLLVKMARIREQIEAIDRLLPGSQERHPASWTPKMAPGSPEESFTPVHSYWPVILQSLVDFVVSARSDIVLVKVCKKINHILNASEHE